MNYSHSRRAFQREKFPVPGVVILREAVVDSFVGIVVGELCPVGEHRGYLQVGEVAVPRTSKG